MQEIYDKLVPHIMRPQDLEQNRFPCRDPNFPSELRRKPVDYDYRWGRLRAVQLRDGFSRVNTCNQCKSAYQVDTETGMPLPEQCRYHNAPALYPFGQPFQPRRYKCCNGLESDGGGCETNPYHVNRGEDLLENYTGYVETRDKSELEPNRHGVYALDCEMFYTTVGQELATVTVVDHRFEVVYEKTVKPKNPILHYKTTFTGLTERDMRSVDATLADVQRDLLELFSSKSILIGHSIDCDMKALKMFHRTFIDTAVLYPHSKGSGYRKSLKHLMGEQFGATIQEGASHTGKEDAVAALRLVYKRAGVSARY